MVEEIPDLIKLGQISPKNTQTTKEGVPGEKGMLRRGFLLNLSSPEPSGFVHVSKRSEFALDLAVPEAQLLVNGLTEAQA